MHTIEGGKVKDESSIDTEKKEAFEQAEMNIGSAEFNDSGTEASSSNESLIGGLDEIYSSGEKKPQLDKKPRKLKVSRKSKQGGVVNAIALLVSVGAVGVAGYSVINQKSGQEATLKNIESLDVAIGNLNTRTDDLTAELSGTKKSIQSNSDRLVSIGILQKDLQNLNTSLSSMRGELDGLKVKLESNSTSIGKQQQRVNELKDELKKVAVRAASAPKRVVQKAPTKNMSTDPSKIEGSYLASIDLWGTQKSVMLREVNGNWIPLTRGDYYKGWRLEGADGYEAIFKQGSKTKRLMIKE
ncbi:hypothetical protein ACJJI4_24020 (plasmid) [Microbulbifer sp. TRSA002]|uniref:hypothetical protein n=1 Tax=Microbulbifer sp. TRSA002 TaxID=3243382 RepID=UPI004039D073